MPKIDLSIIILFSKKTKKLEKAIKSADFAQEILLIKNNNIKNFSQVRNNALKKAKYNYIFFLDSDEIFRKQDILKIKKIIINNKYDLVSVKREDYFLNKKLKYGEVKNIRLIRMGKKNKIKFTRPVHEVVANRHACSVFKSDITLQHFPHDHINNFIKKIKYYARLEARYRYGQSVRNRHACSLLTQLLFWPILKFINNFIFKLGFLDGFRGLIYALMMSLHSLFVRIYLYEFYQKNI